jgi:two-component sensor histidine kinase
MALHELSTNALKYGALSNDSGSVELTWTVERERTPFARLVWQERGGPPVNPPEHRGFGSLLLERTLAQDLRGSVDLEYRREGVRCTIEMPLSSAGGAA